MPHRFTGERTLMRIFIGERDKCRGGAHRGRPLYHALLEYFRGHDFPGASVLRGIAGYGAHNRLHTAGIEVLSLDAPIVVEVVAAEDQIQRALPDLDEMIDGGLVTLERVRVILYRPRDVREDERWGMRAAGLDPDDRDQAP